MSTRYDLVVIGGGTAGLVSAAGAAPLGAKVALIERDRLGGDCLYHGYVPTRTLIKSARVAHLINRSEEFGIKSDGPGLYVYAVAADDDNDTETVLDARSLDLGRLKGNRDSQTYELPPGFDPEEHRAVSIWCRWFTANFVTAPLS